MPDKWRKNGCGPTCKLKYGCPQAKAFMKKNGLKVYEVVLKEESVRTRRKTALRFYKVFL